MVKPSSGKNVPQETAKTIVNLDNIGSSQHEEFINQRLKEKTTAFHAPIKKNKLNTFAVLKKTETIKSNKEIKITAQRNVYAQHLMILTLKNCSPSL